MKSKDGCPDGFRKKGRGWRQFIDCDAPQASILKGKVFCGVRRGESDEWFTYLNGQLIKRGKDDCRSALNAVADKEAVSAAINHAAHRATPIVKVPFQPVLFNDCLNPNAPQLVCKPFNGRAMPDDFLTWMALFHHTGESLDEPLAKGWGAENGVDGVRYIMAWAAIAIREPTARLPLLAMFGHQFVAKNTFADALEILVPRGMYKATKQLRCDDKFDAGLEGMVFAFADEINLAKPTLFQYVKPWITESTVSVRAMYRSPYEVANFSHWLMATNRIEFIPVYDDVSRITVLHLKTIPPEKRLTTKVLKARLRTEAPKVLRYLFDMELPPGDSRTALPMVATEAKEIARSMTDDPLSQDVLKFLEERCRPGESVSLREFTEAYIEWSKNTVKQASIAATLPNADIPVKKRKGYPYVIGFEVKA